MAKIKIYITFSLLFIQVPLLGQSYSVSGYIADKNSGETLIGATIQLEGETKAVITDKYGFFIITGLKPGKYSILISYMGYTDRNITFEINNKGIILPEIRLKEKIIGLDEVTITGIKPDNIVDPSVESSHIALTPQMIQSIPTAGKDVFSAVKYLPGIDGTEPFSPLYSVRGGDPGENGVLLDGVMIYNPYHSNISSGIFNTQIIKNVDMFVGGYGAEFGGKNSSIMYISTKDGNTNEFHGEIEPSTFYSKAFLEFPAGKDASMVFAGRYLLDIPFNFMFQSKNYMYDVNISYTKRINSRNRLTVKYFESKDYMGYNLNTFYKFLGNTIDEFNGESEFKLYDNFFLEQRNDWKNRAATAIHKVALSPRIFLRNQIYYSFHKSNNYADLDFTLDFEEENGETTTLQWKNSNYLHSKIADIGIKSALNIKLASFNTLHAGIEYNYFEFANSIDLNGINNGSFQLYPNLFSGFIENKFAFKTFSLRPGIRLTNYENSGWQYEPRASLSVNLPSNFRIKLAYGEYLQYIISMNTNEVEMNQIVDYYYPLHNLEPIQSVHYVLGLEKKATPTLLMSLDVYYKDMPLVYTFDMNNFVGFSNRLEQGLGSSYGFEILLEGKYKKISGWLSYTYSKAYREFPESRINNGLSYIYDYNRPHTIKGVGSMKLTPNFTFNGSIVFLSGNRRSIETNMQSYYYYDPVSNETMFFPMWTNNVKNAAKMPPTISFDLGIRKKLTHGFGKQLATVLNADESYVSVVIKNILFLYRNVAFYIPASGLEGYEGKYIPIGTNYLPQVGVSYTLKF